MLGQAHTPRRRLLPFAAIALVVLAAPALGIAGGTPSASSLSAQNASLAAKSRAAVLQLYSLEERLGAARAHLASLQSRSASLRAERASLKQQLSVAERGSRIAQAQLAARLRLLYEQGNVEPLEIVFGAKSLDEALSSLDNLSRMTGQGEDVLSDLKAARTSLHTASGKLAGEERALAAASREAEATAAALTQTRTERSAYIGSLAAQRRLNDKQISTLLAQAAAARARTAALLRAPTSSAPAAAAVSATPEPTPAAAPAVPATGGRSLTVSATGYALTGTTATGLPVGWGVVAVDPSVIPLGTHLTIPGYGEAVAADTGGAVTGSTIDLWFPSVAQANTWGRRTVTVVLH